MGTAERIDLIVGSAVREGLRAAVNESGPQRAHKEITSAKPRGSRVSLVAGPGFESVREWFLLVAGGRPVSDRKGSKGIGGRQ